MSQYQVVARNYSESSENKIHSDDIAKKYGFRGALVPGVAVYGHLCHPLVDTLGEQWLAHSTDSLRLLKPTYDGETVNLQYTVEDDQHKVTSHNDSGELTAVLTSKLPGELPEIGKADLFENEPKKPERVEITWDSVVLEQPFTPWEVTLAAEANAKYTREVDDQAALYQNGVAHPHLLLSLANTALTNEYFMPTWIHAGSDTTHRQLLRVDDTITVRCVPVEKWRNKGHEFIRVYITYTRDNEITTEIMHTAIFKLAD